MKHKFIFLGSPGAGKGTMAQKLSTHMGIPHISTGDIFRENIKARTPLGIKVESITSSGGLVPDQLTIALIQDRLKQEDAHHGYILDGFPRTIPQAQALEKLAKIDLAINFAVPQEVVIARLSGRLICSSCKQSYHQVDFPPKKAGICDSCGSTLSVRKDDTIDAVKHRLEVYKKETAPLIDFYREKNLLQTLNSSQELDDVFNELLSLISHK